MNIRKQTLLSTSITLALGLGLSVTATAAPQRVVAQLKQGTDVEALITKLETNGVQVMGFLPQENVLAVDVDPEVVTNYKTLAKLPEIASLELDVKRTFEDYDDVRLASGEMLPWGIQATQATELTALTPRKVCIIDSGYDLGHPDLPGSDRVTGSADGGSGPWDNSDGVGLNYHGTHVAGTIAALGGNGRGVVGVVPDSNITLHIVRTFDKNASFIYASELAGAIQDCADAGANIISMSLGGPLESRVEQQVVSRLSRQGVLVIAAAGNDGDATFGYPASYENVMSVAAVDHALVHADFSQRNAAVDIAAPGVDIVSTVSRDTLIGGLPASYASASGTSMATPHVSGVAALVWSNAPHCSSTEIGQALKASALDLGSPGWDYKYGTGEVQAKAALDYIHAKGCTGQIGSGKF